MYTLAMSKLSIASSAVVTASPSQPCFSRVGQSVGTYAATFAFCEFVTIV